MTCKQDNFYEFLNGINIFLSCWTSGTPLILSVLLPITLILLINSTIFILIMKRHCNCCKNSHSSVNLTSVKSCKDLQSKKKLAIFSTCFVNMGLTWFLSLLVVVSTNIYAKTLFSFLFCCFNTLQGLCIFLVYNLLSKSRRENIKESVKRTLKRVSAQISTSSADTIVSRID